VKFLFGFYHEWSDNLPSSYSAFWSQRQFWLIFISLDAFVVIR